MIYLTSDTHFCHKNIIKYANRPFSSVEEMNEIMVQNWNKTVKPNDEIYHLGDLTFGRNDQHLHKLNGRITLIRGNHDSEKTMEYVYSILEWDVKDYLNLKYKDAHIILFHYPIDSWDRARHGSIHCHGHCHGTFNKYNTNRRRFDIGVDVENFHPISLDEIIERSNKLPIMDAREYEEIQFREENK